ncbi:GatB/YqeY domain-containing protein [Candidatus Parcubacteria bacterium]|nr:MAG: GatB/YqeY domain-containing protein [Candidatus Parcubacteria bacterium]
MDLLAKIKADLTASLKEGAQRKTETLRMVLAAIHNAEVASRSAAERASLRDEEVRAVLQKEAKKRREAARAFREGGREELARKEEEELSYILPYLPQPVSDTELEARVKEIIERGTREFGAVMKEIMAEFRGRVDGKRASEIVRKQLSSCK